MRGSRVSALVYARACVQGSWVGGGGGGGGRGGGGGGGGGVGGSGWEKRRRTCGTSGRGTVLGPRGWARAGTGGGACWGCGGSGEDGRGEAHAICPGSLRHPSLTSADRPCSSTGTTVLSRYVRIGAVCRFILFCTAIAAFSADLPWAHRPHQARQRAKSQGAGARGAMRGLAGWLAGWLARLLGVIVAGARLGRLGLAWLLLHWDLLVRHTRLRPARQRAEGGAWRWASMLITYACAAPSPPPSAEAACVGRVGRCARGGRGAANGWWHAKQSDVLYSSCTCLCPCPCTCTCVVNKIFKTRPNTPRKSNSDSMVRSANSALSALFPRRPSIRTYHPSTLLGLPGRRRRDQEEKEGRGRRWHR